MRDLALILLVGGLVYLTFLRPWLGVLALVVVDLFQPQGYVGGNASDWPIYRILVVALSISILFSPRTRALAFLKQRARLLLDWRILLLALLWLLFLNSTVHSFTPTVAWPKFMEISKILAISLFALLLLDTRRKVEWFLFAIALSIALVAVKGGYWALMTGSGDRVYGPPGSQYYDNNHFAVLAVMGLPLVALFFKRVPSVPLRVVLGFVVAMSVMAVLTSWSRGGLLSLGASLTLLALFTDRRLAVIPLAVVGLVVAFDLLPDDWFSRMETIAGYEQEGSAQGRLSVWRQGWSVAVARPFTGAGPNGWIWAAARDWHSTYVEVLAENGFAAFGVWLVLLMGNLLSLAACSLRAGKPRGESCAAVLVALVGYSVGAAFLALGSWDIYYQLLVVSVLLTKPEVQTAVDDHHSLRGAVPASGRDGVTGPSVYTPIKTRLSFY